MAASTGPVLMAGAVVFVSEGVVAPLAGGAAHWNWKIIPATAGLALALGGLEKLAPGFAVGLAWLALLTALVLPVAGDQPPLSLAGKALGIGGKVLG